MVSANLSVLVAQLCLALDGEREENLFRVGCREDCREHEGSHPVVFRPQLLR